MESMKLKGEVASIARRARASVPEAVSPAALKLIDAGTTIRQDPESAQWAFMARQLVQCTLPHKNPGEITVWSRTNGNLTLGIKPGYELKTGKSIGFPYGTIPRLLLFWMVTEAKRSGQRRLELGHSLAEFMRAVNLDPSRGGKRSDARRLREQMRRLFGATISFEQSLSGPDRQGVGWLDMQVAPKGELWWDTRDPEQPTLWGSWIQLGEDFFNAIIAAPVPLDMRALCALKRSSLALDLYAVMNYRAHTAKERAFLPWELLMKQLGTDFADPKLFKRKALAALRKVLTVAPYLKIEQARGGLILHPSRSAIAAREKS